MGVFRLLLALVFIIVLVVFCVQNLHIVDIKFRLAPAASGPSVSGEGSPPAGAVAGGDGQSLLERLSFAASLPLFLIVLLSMAAGVLVGGLIGLADQFRLRSQLRKKDKAVKKLEGEVQTLRNLPLEEEGEEGFKA